jgi:hypothetical protein
MPIKRTVFSVKKADSAHPNSRKASQLKRALLRDDKLAGRIHSAATSKQHPLVDKLTWFQLQMDERPSYSLADANHFIVEYVRRNEEEIERLQGECRPKRPVPARLALLQALREREEDEHRTGSFEMVDLTTSKGCAAFRKWSGDYNAMSLLKLIKYKKQEINK